MAIYLLACCWFEKRLDRFTGRKLSGEVDEWLFHQPDKLNAIYLLARYSEFALLLLVWRRYVIMKAI